MRKHRKQPDRGKSGGKPVRPLAAPLVVRPGDEIAAVDLTRLSLPEAIPVSLEAPVPDGMDDLEDVTDLMGPPPGMHGAPLGYSPGATTHEFDQHGLGFDPDDMPMFPTMRRSTPLPLLDATRLPDPVEPPLPATPTTEAHPVVAPLLDDLDGGHMFHVPDLPLDASRYRSEPTVEPTEAVTDTAGWDSDPTAGYGGWQPAAEIAPLYADEPATGVGESDVSGMEPDSRSTEAHDEIDDLVEALSPQPPETATATALTPFLDDTVADDPGAAIPDALRLHEDDEPLWKPRHRGNPAPDEGPEPAGGDSAPAQATTLISSSPEATHLSLIEGISDLESSAFDETPVTALADLTLELSDTGALDATLPIEVDGADEALVFTLDNNDPGALHVDLPESMLGHPLTLVVPAPHDHTHNLADLPTRDDLTEVADLDEDSARPTDALQAVEAGAWTDPSLIDLAGDFDSLSREDESVVSDDFAEATESATDGSIDADEVAWHDPLNVDVALNDSPDEIELDLTEDLPEWALSVESPAPLDLGETSPSVAEALFDGTAHEYAEHVSDTHVIQDAPVADLALVGIDEQPSWATSDDVVEVQEPQAEDEVQAGAPQPEEPVAQEPQAEDEAVDQEPQAEATDHVGGEAEDEEPEVQEPQAEVQEPQAEVQEPQDEAEVEAVAEDQVEAEDVAEVEVEVEEPQAEDQVEDVAEVEVEDVAEDVAEVEVEDVAEVQVEDVAEVQEPQAEVEVQGADVHLPGDHGPSAFEMGEAQGALKSKRGTAQPVKRRGERMRESAFAATARLQGRTAAEWVAATESVETAVTTERGGRWQVPDTWAGTDAQEAEAMAAVVSAPPSTESSSIFDQIAADSGFRPLSVSD